MKTRTDRSDKAPAKHSILIVASKRARHLSSSRLLRLIRDNAHILREYRIHTTKGTGDRICGTGLFQEGEVKLHRHGIDGGIARLAAMAARSEFSAVILLLDPSDPWSDSVEYRALKRVCIQLRILLITTYMAAQRWLTLEAPQELKSDDSSSLSSVSWQPDNWRKGRKNVVGKGVHVHISVKRRTVALISHDKKKIDMVEFVNDASEVLGKHQRVLTTGTTGWILKLLFAGQSQEPKLIKQARLHGGRIIERRLMAVLKEMLRVMRGEPEIPGLIEEIEELKDRRNGARDLGVLLGEVRDQAALGWGKPFVRNSRFVNKVMPLPSGPHGGDVLIAESILDNECHSIVFFHDPMTAHPHNADIRLLERTSQQAGVFAECVSDPTSSRRWLGGLDIELAGEETRAGRYLAYTLRRKAKLHEVILVKRLRNEIDCDSGGISSDGDVSSAGATPTAEDTQEHYKKRVEKYDDDDGDALGFDLVKAGAGYFNQRLLDIIEHKKDEVRVAISWGWACYHILEALKEMSSKGILEKPDSVFDNVIWLPIIGTITSEVTAEEANIIVEDFCNFYGGRVEGIPFSGFVRSGSRVPGKVDDVIERLENADIVLTAASPWNVEAALAKHTGLDLQQFPRFHEAVGLVSGVFLNEEGQEVKREYSTVGLGFKGFKKAAKRQAVIMVCGGTERRPILAAALKARMVSSLVTTRATAGALLKGLAQGSK